MGDSWWDIPFWLFGELTWFITEWPLLAFNSIITDSEMFFQSVGLPEQYFPGEKIKYVAGFVTYVFPLNEVISLVVSAFATIILIRTIRWTLALIPTVGG